MSIKSGAAQFGQDGQFGVVTKQDLLRLLIWSFGFAAQKQHRSHAPGLRKLIRQLKPLFGAPDAITLAEVLAANPEEEWVALAEELREWANRPLFKQD